jgi:hypothetical protein
MLEALLNMLGLDVAYVRLNDHRRRAGFDAFFASGAACGVQTT